MSYSRTPTLQLQGAVKEEEEQKCRLGSPNGGFPEVNPTFCRPHPWVFFALTGECSTKSFLTTIVARVVLGRESLGHKIVRVFVPNFAPNFAPDFLHFFRGVSLFPEERRTLKIHKKKGRSVKKYHKSFLESQQGSDWLSLRQECGKKYDRDHQRSSKEGYWGSSSGGSSIMFNYVELLRDDELRVETWILKKVLGNPLFMGTIASPFVNYWA